MLPADCLAEIFAFLESKENLALNRVCQLWRVGVTLQWELRLALFMSEIERHKAANSEALGSRLSFAYEACGFFSPHFFFLDTILSQESGFLVSKHDLNELKLAVRSPKKLAKQVSKAVCILLGLKPKRKG